MMIDQPVYIFAPVAEMKYLRTIMNKTGVVFKINDYQVRQWSSADQICYFKYPQLDQLQQLLVKSARAAGARVDALFAFFETHFGQIEIDLLEPQHLLQMEVKFTDTPDHRQKLRRGADILLSLGGLALFFVPGVLIALLIKLDSSGPVFFLQQRTGLYNREFTIVKFRSMYTDAERQGARWADDNDPRITTVGRYLRKLRVDEIPQLWNVLRGEMSLIGPRPEREVFIRQLEKQIPYYRFRHLVKPGITGLAQVMYVYGSSVEDARHKHRYDLYYIKHRNWKLDLHILRKTFLTIIRAAGV